MVRYLRRTNIKIRIPRRSAKAVIEYLEMVLEDTRMDGLILGGQFIERVIEDA